MSSTEMNKIALPVLALALAAPADAAAQQGPRPPAPPWAYYAPYAPPYDPCRVTDECREQGRCTSYDGECVASSAYECQRAEACRDDGLCVFNPEEKRCDDGTRRADTGMYVGGVVVSGIGGATFVAGIAMLLIGGLSGVGCIDAERPCGTSADELATAGGIMMGGGAVLALGVGLPLALAGKRPVPREPVAPGVQLGVGPGGVSLAGSF
jgi:hypothetical protein